MSLRKLLDSALFLPRYFGWKAEQMVNRFARIECYQLNGDRLVRTRGLKRQESVKIGDIVGWWIVHEMTFDIVYLRLMNAQLVQWYDINDELLSLLRRVIPERREKGTS